MSESRGVVSMCASCRYHERVVKRECQLNERRVEYRRPVDLTLIRKSREAMASCSRCHPTTDSA